LTDYVKTNFLSILSPFPNLKHSFVATVICADGSSAVLKAGIPGQECLMQASALRHYNGQSCVRLLGADLENGIMLLEYLEPGVALTTLADELNDQKATSIACSVMRGLWAPIPSDNRFPTVADWGQSFNKIRTMFEGKSGPIPGKMFDLGEKLFSELLASSESSVLLHGDLHHDNILSAQRQPWLAIDPKGVVGEPAYETGAILRNLWSDRHRISNPKELLTRRIHQFAEELEIDIIRIHGWAVAQAVLAACWGLEDGEGFSQGWFEIAEQLAGIKV
jgi:streptomycin 6-kinase